ALQPAPAVRQVLRDQRGADRGAGGGAGRQGRGRAAGGGLARGVAGGGAAGGPDRAVSDAAGDRGAVGGAGGAGAGVLVEFAGGEGGCGFLRKSFATCVAPTKGGWPVAASAAPTRWVPGEADHGSALHQCFLLALAPWAWVISTCRVKLRGSSGHRAPTPITWRFTSSPRSLRMLST